jgi:hypothetical protein
MVCYLFETMGEQWRECSTTEFNRIKLFLSGRLKRQCNNVKSPCVNSNEDTSTHEIISCIGHNPQTIVQIVGATCSIRSRIYNCFSDKIDCS